MQCYRQPSFLKGKPTPIAEVWEVRLPTRLMDTLRKIAGQRGKTLSTITRFCSLPLADRTKLRWLRHMRSLQKLDKQEYSQGRHHRHLVCLYGDDALLLRLAALRLRISVSAFIRLALRLYLNSIAMENQSKRKVTDDMLYWLGIKRWCRIPLEATAIPIRRRYLFLSFPPEWRW